MLKTSGFLVSLVFFGIAVFNPFSNVVVDQVGFKVLLKLPIEDVEQKVMM